MSINCDFSKWEANMTVKIINRRADVRLIDEQKCLGAHTRQGSPKVIDGYCSDCDYFMGCDTSKFSSNNPAYIGDIMKGCCWKKILEKENSNGI